MGRLIEAFAQFFDNDGNPLINGWLEFLESGSNNTKKNTYNDVNLQIVNANPIQLDGSGRCPSVFGTGDYRIVSYTRNIEDEADVGSMVQMFDPVTAAGTSTGGGGGAGLVDWSNTDTYNVGDIVTYNTKVYRSLINGNVGLNPATETSSWEEIEFLQVWNTNVTYEINNLVHYEGNIYVSRTSLNTGNQPDETPTYWRPLSDSYVSANVKTTDYEILPSERDNFFVLSASAAADSQFDLPVMGATTDLFRVGIYNASDYDLTINALGGLPVWIDSGGDVIIPKGTQIEVIYIHALTAWVVMNNSLYVLGNQNLADNAKLYFGSDKDSYFVFDGSNTRLELGNGNFNIYSTGSVLRWTINQSGTLYPDTPLDIGSINKEIGNIFLGDGYKAQFGSDQDATIHHDGSNFYLAVTVGDMIFSAGGSIRWGLNSSGHIIPNAANTYDIGSSTYPVNDIYVEAQPDADNKVANKAYVDGVLIVPDNILINSDFEWNHRKVASGANIPVSGTYFLDCWKTAAADSAPSWTGGVVTIPAGDRIAQTIEKYLIPNGTYTISWTGTSQCSTDGGSTFFDSPHTFAVTGVSNFTITFDDGTVGSPMLVPGSVPVPWQPKNRAAERDMVERYYQTPYFAWFGKTNTGQTYTIQLNLRVAMPLTAAATIPSVALNGMGTPGVTTLEDLYAPNPREIVGIRILSNATSVVDPGYFYGSARLIAEL